ncbi:MAG: leucine-rich repeat domain-containing protein [Ureaplasma sp.]|nr:leucine-rich repeat domain-containing protein [Ureaplasma sp.]
MKNNKPDLLISTDNEIQENKKNNKKKILALSLTLGILFAASIIVVPTAIILSNKNKNTTANKLNFSTINVTIDKLKEKIQKYIDTNNFDEKQFIDQINSAKFKNEILKYLSLTDETLIKNITFINNQLIIKAKDNFQFIANESTNLIINGDIVISDLSFYIKPKFINLSKLFDTLNAMIKTSSNWYKPDQFQEYINNNLVSLKQTVATNLETNNNLKLSTNDILNISLENFDEIFIKLNTQYQDYEIESNKNFIFIDNTLIIKRLNFNFEESPDICFNLNGNEIQQLSSYGQRQNIIILPSKINRCATSQLFMNNENIQYANMSLSSITNLNTNLVENQTLFFYGAKNLKKAVLPNNLENINDGFFQYCQNLVSVDLPLTLKRINHHAFANCPSLKYLIIPDTIEFIDKNAFKDSSINLYVSSEAMKNKLSDWNLNGVNNIIVQ